MYHNLHIIYNFKKTNITVFTSFEVKIEKQIIIYAIIIYLNVKKKLITDLVSVCYLIYEF